ncbi:MAG: LamG-like jellyroll fold domain-containing protein [Thermoanaerobaculia bacterium]|nr:LamG-like jellyroll fold domain-containing protein [Thermoanaerobaculia bacterium]
MGRTLLLVALVVGTTSSPVAAGSLRFYGSGVLAPTLDRVVIPLETDRPVDVGAGDFTVEVWLRALPGENASTAACTSAVDDWITGNIVLDRDVFGPGDAGDWGLALKSGRVVFGVAAGSTGVTLCGSRTVTDGQWHHVAVTRQATTGALVLWVDGFQDAAAVGPTGDLSYRDGRVGSTWDPYLVLGAEKHDAGAEYPSFSGWLDELRLSTVRRYTTAFVPPTRAFDPDAATAALYHFDAGTGTTVADATPGGASPGTRRPGGVPEGPAWASESPFAATIFSDGFESGSTAAWSSTSSGP